MQFDYMKTPLNKYTFSNKRIKKWVEQNCKGRVLNLFAGKTALDVQETRNDENENMPADYHMDALKFVTSWTGPKFDTIVLDPPYSLRKSMEMYEGKITSPFNALKDKLLLILNPQARVITFGYHSVSMGEKRGFRQERLLLMYHGGAIHDTIAIIERKFK